VTATAAPIDEERRTGLWWNDGSAWRTRLFDAISLMLPSGEQFVIDAVADWLKTSGLHPSTPRELRQEAQRLVDEEGVHQRAHRRYNERLAAHAPVQRLEQRIATAMAPMATWDLPTRIAFAAAFEQLTTLLSAEVMRERNAWLGQGNAPQIQLWRWHCREEIAHGHVAHDVLRAMKLGHGRRVLAFLASAAYIGLDLAVSLAVMCKADVQAGRIRGWQLVAQAAAFTVRVMPSVVRMAWGGVRYIVTGRALATKAPE
jgi:predicted metal-dependent hydrolase